MHHYECVAPDVDINLRSGRFCIYVMYVRTGRDVEHRAGSTCSLWRMTDTSPVNKRRSFSMAARRSAADSRETWSIVAGDITTTGSMLLSNNNNNKY